MQKSEKQFPERADSSMCNKTIYELKTNVQTPLAQKERVPVREAHEKRACSSFS